MECFSNWQLRPTGWIDEPQLVIRLHLETSAQDEATPRLSVHKMKNVFS